MPSGADGASAFAYMTQHRWNRLGTRAVVDTPMDIVEDAEDAVARGLDSPVLLARPHVVEATVTGFVGAFPGRVMYAVKANPAAWLTRAIADVGVAMFDVASLSEVGATAALAPGATLAFMNPVKSRSAIARAYHDHGVRIASLDHAGELSKMADVLGPAGVADMTLAVRLAVDFGGAGVSLAGKFGASAEDGAALLQAVAAAGATPALAFHIGSQCMTPTAYASAIALCARVADAAGVTPAALNVGGGFPAPYPGLTPPPLASYVAAIEEARALSMRLRDVPVWCEPGRALAAGAESLLVRVELRKGDALYVNDGTFARLYDAGHERWRFPVRRVGRDTGAALAPYRLFGPTCDSSDVMAGPFQLPADMAEGETIEIGMAGAYCRAMASDFNGFGAVETLIARDDPWAIHAPETARPERARTRRGRGAAEAVTRRLG